MNMLGYYKDPQGTREAFTEDGFFRTGDLVHLDPDGQVKIIGRVKEQFKTSKGKYVAPAPLESKLMAHPAVEACCVMGAGLPSPLPWSFCRRGARKTVRRSGRARELWKQSLLERMNEINAQVDPHERMSFIAIVDGPWTIGNEFLTPTLKVKRAALERRYLGWLRVGKSSQARWCGNRSCLTQAKEEPLRPPGGIGPPLREVTAVSYRFG